MSGEVYTVSPSTPMIGIGMRPDNASVTMWSSSPSLDEDNDIIGIVRDVDLLRYTHALIGAHAGSFSQTRAGCARETLARYSCMMPRSFIHNTFL
jgi:hypothetical protein